ncbi:MAG: hypothetical protein AB8G18_08140 [Gammaproteobacteria bacterium]
MIRLTVLYNLPEGHSEESFLEWRLSEHQSNNEAMPGVQRTDFARVTEQWPEQVGPKYRFQTIVEWSDRDSFEASFYGEETQASIKTNLEKLGDYCFLVSEVLAESASSTD